jgi:hypothetical protein
MPSRLTVILTSAFALTLTACDKSDQKTDESHMGDVGRGSTSSGTAGGGTISTSRTHPAENTDGASPASQGTTGSATVTTHDTTSSAPK